MNPKRMLVAFYSRSGNTKKVAESIGKVLGCDTEEIFDTKNRAGIWGFMISGFDATFNKPTVIRPIKRDPSAYDLVIVGSPVWNNAVSTPIRTYLTQYRDRLKDVAFFCTHSSGEPRRPLQQMEDISGKKPVGLLALSVYDLNHGGREPKVRAFTERLRAKLAQS
jgi:flavodoxin